jgi:hypothetical protein
MNAYGSNFCKVQQQPIKVSILFFFQDSQSGLHTQKFQFTYAGKFQLYQELWLKGRDILEKFMKNSVRSLEFRKNFGLQDFDLS